MGSVSLEFLERQLELGEALRLGRAAMFEPQDLPGRFGRVVKAIDHVLQSIGCEAVVGDGWAVWRHGYVARLTQDIDIVVPADRLDEFRAAAAVAGFDVLATPAGRWPKLVHRETGIQVDILPEGGRPGTPAHPAPTTIPHPAALGARGSQLRYMSLPDLVGLKIAAGRARDENDVVELVRANPDQVGTIRQQLAETHPDYAATFDRLVERAREQDDA